MSSQQVTPMPLLKERVTIVRHYQRSIRLDSDLGRVDALDGYICHGTARTVLESMSRQLLDNNQRAFTWTGPFGGGKSSLALTLASALGPDSNLRKKARRALNLQGVPAFDNAFPVKRNGWVAIPVVGKRGSIVEAISRALRTATGEQEDTVREKLDGTALIEALCAAAADKHNDGILLIIDELGKFLEASASGGDDIQFFQDLAEAAGRASGRLVVVGILHQAFKQYATRLGLEFRDDWAKIQGRYSDIPLIAASDEVVELVGRAISTDVAHPSTRDLAEAVADSIRHRRASIGESFGESLDRCWPLHPTMAALLGPASRRQFGQNERSTFGFLSSGEPYGFSSFLTTQPLLETALYRPENYWDFLRANLEPAILASSDGHRWAQAAEAVERTEARGDTLHISLIKNIAVIDLFRNGSGLAAENTVLRTLYPELPSQEIERALEDLSRWRIAVFRKHVGAWSVFEGSDFDIDAAVAQVRSTQSGLDLNFLTRLANLFPIVAKRHYYETGTLRWMGISLCHLEDVHEKVSTYKPAAGEFGQFVLVLPNQETSPESAVERCREAINHATSPVILGVPKNFEKLYDLGLELVSLQFVESKRPELEGDSVARRELVARIAYVRSSLEEALRSAFSQAQWLENLGIEPKVVRLSSFASDIADRLYSSSPRLWSELVNRDSLSSNSVKARRELLYRMLENESKENLGIEGFPAERGLFETLLRNTGLHRYDTMANCGGFFPPDEETQKKFFDIWGDTKKLLGEDGQRVGVREIYDLWSKPPFGLREGVNPILFMAFILSNKKNTALYKDGIFIPRLTDANIDELLQDEKRFEIRWVTMDNEKETILNGIGSILAEVNGSNTTSEPLEAARGLVALVLELPRWSQRTQRLSKEARSIRDTLLKASDPHKVLFVDLPALLGSKSGEGYLEALKSPLSELVDAYENMLQDVTDRMLQALNASSHDFSSLRSRAVAVAGASGDFRLDAFATRLQSYDGGRAKVEDILSLAANKPPRDWNDRDIDAALIAIAEWALRFCQIEALVAVQGRSPSREAYAVVIGTGFNGRTASKSFDIADRERPAVNELAADIVTRLSAKGYRPEMLLAALAEAGVTIMGNTGGEN